MLHERDPHAICKVRVRHAGPLLSEQGWAPPTPPQRLHAGCCSITINAAAVNKTGEKKEIKIIATNWEEFVCHHCPKRNIENSVTQFKKITTNKMELCNSFRLANFSCVEVKNLFTQGKHPFNLETHLIVA